MISLTSCILATFVHYHLCNSLRGLCHCPFRKIIAENNATNINFESEQAKYKKYLRMEQICGVCGNVGDGGEGIDESFHHCRSEVMIKN